MQSYTSTFKALAEPTRLRIVALLLRAQKELCVCEFVDALEEPQYHVSRSLKILQAAGLLMERPEGKWVYYALPPAADDFQRFLLQAIAALPEKTLDKDQRELNRRLKLREDGKCLSGVRKIHLLSRKP
jgi:ArsR family transcriptional regulator, arsenate/arsenite/antimonite-responsive transcriptional repressor